MKLSAPQLPHLQQPIKSNKFLSECGISNKINKQQSSWLLGKLNKNSYFAIVIVINIYFIVQSDRITDFFQKGFLVTLLLTITLILYSLSPLISRTLVPQVFIIDISLSIKSFSLACKQVLEYYILNKKTKTWTPSLVPTSPFRKHAHFSAIL